MSKKSGVLCVDPTAKTGLQVVLCDLAQSLIIGAIQIQSNANGRVRKGRLAQDLGLEPRQLNRWLEVLNIDLASFHVKHSVANSN